MQPFEIVRNTVKKGRIKVGDKWLVLGKARLREHPGYQSYLITNTETGEFDWIDCKTLKSCWRFVRLYYPKENI